jgi:hypothetical protein
MIPAEFLTRHDHPWTHAATGSQAGKSEEERPQLSSTHKVAEGGTERYPVEANVERRHCDPGDTEISSIEGIVAARMPCGE